MSLACYATVGWVEAGQQHGIPTPCPNLKQHDILFWLRGIGDEPEDAAGRDAEPDPPEDQDSGHLRGDYAWAFGQKSSWWNGKMRNDPRKCRDDRKNPKEPFTENDGKHQSDNRNAHCGQ